MLKLFRRYMTWVQNSVFEGELTEAQYANLKAEAEALMEPEEDSMIFWSLREPVLWTARRWADEPGEDRAVLVRLQEDLVSSPSPEHDLPKTLYINRDARMPSAKSHVHDNLRVSSPSGGYAHYRRVTTKPRLRPRGISLQLRYGPIFRILSGALNRTFEVLKGRPLKGHEAEATASHSESHL